MANVKISQLPVTGTPSTIGSIPIVQDGTTYSTTAADLVALVTNTDVTNALGYTPISPTTLATQLADYVPEARTLTINGTTQDLSANRTFTVETGAATYPFTGSSINAGEAVLINADGTISSVVSSDPVPTVNITRKGVLDYTVFASSIGYQGLRARVSPHDPSLVVRSWIDAGSSTLYITSTQNNDTETNFAQPGILTVTSGIDNCDFQFDPFNPNLILVMYKQSGNMYLQYISINHTYNNSNAPLLAILGSPFNIPAANWDYYGFQFSVKYPNTLVAQYSDTNSAQLPYVVSMLITPMGVNSFTVSTGTAYSLYTVGYYGPTNYIQQLSRLEGTDTFMAYLNPYDPGLSGYINQVVLFTIDPTYSDYNTVPTLVLGAAQQMVDYTNPSYQFAAVLGAIFLSATKIAYTFKEGMANNYYTVIGNVSGLTVSSIGSPNQFGSAYGLTNASTAVYALPINGQQYITFIGIPNSGGDAGNIVAGIGKVTGNTIAFTDLGALAINSAGVDMTAIGTFLGAGMVAFTPSVVNGGVVFANLFWFNNTSSAYGYFKTSTIKYINKVFTNQTLLGIAQNSVVTSATVQVLPFGGIDDNQGSLVAGTSYYLQENGVLTTNVTPTLLGTALSSALIKTANYPTI